MEIKVIIFIAILLISVISSIVRGLKKFNENRPGMGPRPTESQEQERDPLRDLVRELEETFGSGERTYSPPVQRKEVPATYVETQEAVSSEEIYSPRYINPELSRESMSPIKIREPHRTVMPEAAEGQAFSNQLDLPKTRDDLRKMVIWSAILNRPQY